nr:MAG TPA: hypothetical protein [Caudoviricetes sp.]
MISSMLSPRDSESAYSLTILVYCTNVNFSIVFCYLMIFIFISTFSKSPPDTTMSGLFLPNFQGSEMHLSCFYTLLTSKNGHACV